MSNVTYSTKCYTFVCAGCAGLAQSHRRDTLTCSSACRVRAHRNGSFKAIHTLASTMKIDAADILKAKAIMMLAPALNQSVAAGTMTIDDAQPAMAAKFGELLAALCRGGRK